MRQSKPKSVSLADRLKALPESKTVTKWIDRVPQGVREELEEVRRQYWAGAFPGQSKISIARFLCKEAGLTIHPRGITEWLDEHGQTTQG